MYTQTRLTRSATDKILGGVCGGLGQYFGIDPVIVRLVFVALVFAGGISVVLYPILWLIMPAAYSGEPAVAAGLQEMQQVGQQVKGQVQDALGLGSAQACFDPQTGQPVVAASNRNRVLGTVLLGIGILMLAHFIPGGTSAVVALMLLAGGVYLLRQQQS